ncbi:hypothetical protein [Leptolyngbya iicbica]|uniref:Helix-turn-helix domain-containing protein n=2 Tax=Cyanophyceae TaxID=3028117 RepID=A0A4Q7EAF5_9CYAN|nr:hypothetical protein [Leptolyngbya sp. LK]RZM79571.1 hypothetical protein DYY88_12700 [Leptolyngbya sp. LK]
MDNAQILTEIRGLLEDSSRQMAEMRQEILALREQVESKRPDWISKQQALELLGVSDRTLERYHSADYCQRQGWTPLIKGVHSTIARPVRFNGPLLEDWLINRSNHRLHQKAIARWQNRLPSYQKRKVN